MFITIFDIIEQKILDYYSCPPNPDPKRVKLFWKMMLCIFIFALCIVAAISILVPNEIARLILGVSFIVIGFALMKYRRKKEDDTMLKWWNGQISLRKLIVTIIRW